MPKKAAEKGVTQYTYEETKRLNNPPVGLVTAQTDHLNGKKKYQYDPHIDPQLQWAGKTEGTSFEVDTVSLHVHERIDPLTILEAVKSEGLRQQQSLFHYFETPENNPPIREAIEFYKHSQDWSNRLIAGDSLLVMNSLLEKEGMGGKVQMIYIDPPYGIKYGSNFQPFVNKRDVKDGKDEDLTQEPEMIKAFRDTWELGIHSYLSYLRDRLKLAKELLTESGSCFVQISDENVHHVKEIMDEVFTSQNFVSIIPFRKTVGATSGFLATVNDYIIWYARNKTKLKFHSLMVKRTNIEDSKFSLYETPKGELIPLAGTNIDSMDITKTVALDDLTSQDPTKTGVFSYTYNGATFEPGRNRHWRTTKEGLDRLSKLNRLIIRGEKLLYERYFGDFPVTILNNFWFDTVNSFEKRLYVVQTAQLVVQRCLLMTTDPGDLVFDPTCGSGTTAYVAEQWGRRWITCDTSRVAVTLAKQRLMTSIFDYYELAHPNEGVSSGFTYKTVPHVTLGSIANNEPPQQETLYDQPLIDAKKKRVTGPFTVEAVPSQRVRSLDEIDPDKATGEADITIARSGETLRQNEWMQELASTGVRGKGGQKLEFSRIEPLPATRWLHAEGETKDGQKAVISFGPEYAPLEQRQVELAVQDAQSIVPKPKIIVFAAFQFDPEAAKDIDELKWPGVNILKVQMSQDLLTHDLKKKRASNESFWLMGQPDVEIRKHGDKYVVEVNGFDYYNTRTGEIESGDASKIALWELDTDYDGRSIYPRQVFFIMEPGKEQLEKLSRNLKGLIDEELIMAYFGKTSLPFKLGKNLAAAVKIIDDRGIESIKILRVNDG